MVIRGRFNSSITRVRPVFQELLNRDRTGLRWLPALLGIATCNVDYAEKIQKNAGRIQTFCSDLRTYDDRILKFYGVNNVQLEGCFERSLPPPSAFLSWLISHPEEMVWPHTRGRRRTFGQPTQLLREQLFGEHGGTQKDKIQRLALNELAELGGIGSLRKWWAFEGFSDIDCCLETDQLVLLIEGKRTEGLGPSTDWYPKRNQLIRNLEVAESIASGREYAVMVLSEQDIGLLSEQILAESLPHFGPVDRDRLMCHYLGCITWADVCKTTNIPFSGLPGETRIVAETLRDRSAT